MHLGFHVFHVNINPLTDRLGGIRSIIDCGPAKLNDYPPQSNVDESMTVKHFLN